MFELGQQIHIFKAALFPLYTNLMGGIQISAVADGKKEREEEEKRSQWTISSVTAQASGSDQKYAKTVCKAKFTWVGIM